MRRDEATRLIESVLAAVTAAERTDAVRLVTAIDVFGSYARGALDPHDVDLNVEYDRQASLDVFDLYEWMEGKVTSAIKTGLAGRTRKIQMQFEMRVSPARYPEVTLVPLWRTGEDLATALGRLRAITADPTAGRALREHMLPELEGLDEHLPVFMRGHICKAVAAGALRIEQLTLTGQRVRDETVADHLDWRWKPGGALNRAGHAVAAYFEARGVDPGTVHLHGQDVREGATPYFAGFAGRYLRLVPHYVSEYGAVEHLEIPAPPTMSRPLVALRLITLNRSWFAESQTHLWASC